MEKDFRFAEKKIDSSWKEEVAKQKGGSKEAPGSEPKSALSLTTFLTSLGYQTLMHLGELPHPQTQERHLDLDAARETIDLLVLLEEKTRGNRNAEEDKLLKTLLPDLQMKFVEKVSPS